MSNSPPSSHDRPARSDRLLAATGALLVLAAITLAQWRPLGDPDLFWHLKTADYMVTHHTFLRQNTFSWAAPHHPWINFHWLAQLVMWGFWKTGGVAGLYVWRGLLLLGGWGALYAASLRAKTPPALTALVMLAAIFYSRWRFHDRPELFSMALVLTWWWLLPRTRPGQWRGWLPLWGLELLWANLHGLFVMGPLLAGWWVLQRNLVSPQPLKTWLKDMVFGAVLVLASLANPFGVGLFSVALQHSSQRFLQPLGALLGFLGIPVQLKHAASLSLISEFTPLLEMVHGPDLWVFAGLTLSAFLSGGAWLIFRSPAQPTINAALRWRLLLRWLADAALLALLVQQSLAHVRSSFVCGWVAAGLVLIRLGEINWPRWARHPLWFGVAALWLLALWPAGGSLEIKTVTYPGHALAFARRHHFSSRLLHDQHDGGFILFHSYPRFKTFVDPRFGFPDGLWRDYEDLSRHPWRLVAIAQKYGAQTVLRQNYFSRPQFYARYPADGPFTLRYFDDQHHLLARRGTNPSAPAFHWLCPCAPGPWLRALARGPHKTEVAQELVRLRAMTPKEKSFVANALSSAWARFTGQRGDCRRAGQSLPTPEHPPFSQLPAKAFWKLERRACLTGKDPFFLPPDNPQAALLLAQAEGELPQLGQAGFENELLRLVELLQTTAPGSAITRRALKVAHQNTGLVFPEMMKKRDTPP